MNSKPNYFSGYSFPIIDCMTPTERELLDRIGLASPFGVRYTCPACGFSQYYSPAEMRRLRVQFGPEWDGRRWCGRNEHEGMVEFERAMIREYGERDDDEDLLT